MTENTLLTNKHFLIGIGVINDQWDYLKNNFCGNVIDDIEVLSNTQIPEDSVVYLCGDVKIVWRALQGKNANIVNSVYLVNGMFSGYDVHDEIPLFGCVGLGEVPVNIHNVGVFFREYFAHQNIFGEIENAHEFQSLTESNKAGKAYRTGVYLTNVETVSEESEGSLAEETKSEGSLTTLQYHLLRCSSNLDGPTENFRDIDKHIINKVNIDASHLFEQPTQLNHVLAQIYHNQTIDSAKGIPERKAKIKAHSDKTKDMPREGLIAFCTFYDPKTFTRTIKKSKTDPYDYVYKTTSVLTSLRFRLKKCVDDPNLTKDFSVKLYPNSVFIISLATNRVYTHEIVPSVLSNNLVPTRLGYVIRCSNKLARYTDRSNRVLIESNGGFTELEEMDEESEQSLRDLYYEENTTANIVEYPPFNFSMNQGDYKRPNI